MKESKNILITGGNGFIGRHLTSALTKEGHSVILLDINQNYIWTTKGEFEEGWKHTVIDIDVTSSYHDLKNSILEIDECMPIHQIYHLACHASPPKYQENSLHTLETCFRGTMNICRLALEFSSRVVFASTSEVYGNPEVHPQVEEYNGNVNPIGPRSCYDEGKRVAETICYEYSRMGLDVRIARIFNTYGPGMCPGDGRVVPNFVSQSLQGSPLTFYGTGTQTRSFCFVSDMIRGLCILMNSSDPGIGPFNLGNPIEFTVKDLARIVYESVHGNELRPEDIIYQKMPKNDPIRRKPNITRATQILGWVPTVNLKEGIEMTIDDFRRRCFN